MKFERKAMNFKRKDWNDFFFKPRKVHVGLVVSVKLQW